MAVSNKDIDILKRLIYVASNHEKDIYKREIAVDPNTEKYDYKNHINKFYEEEREKELLLTICHKIKYAAWSFPVPDKDRSIAFTINDFKRIVYGSDRTSLCSRHRFIDYVKNNLMHEEWVVGNEWAIRKIHTAEPLPGGQCYTEKGLLASVLITKLGTTGEIYNRIFFFVSVKTDIAPSFTPNRYKYDKRIKFLGGRNRTQYSHLGKTFLATNVNINKIASLDFLTDVKQNENNLFYTPILQPKGTKEKISIEKLLPPMNSYTKTLSSDALKIHNDKKHGPNCVFYVDEINRIQITHQESRLQWSYINIDLTKYLNMFIYTSLYQYPEGPKTQDISLEKKGYITKPSEKPKKNYFKPIPLIKKNNNALNSKHVINIINKEFNLKKYKSK